MEVRTRRAVASCEGRGEGSHGQDGRSWSPSEGWRAWGHERGLSGGPAPTCVSATNCLYHFCNSCEQLFTPPAQAPQKCVLKCGAQNTGVPGVGEAPVTSINGQTSMGLVHAKVLQAICSIHAGRRRSSREASLVAPSTPAFGWAPATSVLAAGTLTPALTARHSSPRSHLPKRCPGPPSHIHA